MQMMAITNIMQGRFCVLLALGLSSCGAEKRDSATPKLGEDCSASDVCSEGLLCKQGQCRGTLVVSGSIRSDFPDKVGLVKVAIVQSGTSGCGFGVPVAQAEVDVASYPSN